MEIKSENKLKKYFKRFGALTLACVFAVAIALTITFTIPRNEPGTQVTTTPISFNVPMNGAVVVKDYSEDRLQYNASLKRWEIHLAVDLTSEDNLVMAACDGVVASVDSNSLEGTVVKIQHSDGFVSIYSSLSDQVKVKEGDKVTKGQEIGKASDAASNESATGGHLHFMLLKDNVEVDPNNYLDLQNK